MIIDIHTRVWSSLDQFGRETADRLRRRYAESWSLLDGSPAAHEQAMACVDGVCVLGFRSELLGAAIPNELVAEYVSRDSRRRFGIAGIDPLAETALEEIDHAVSLGLVGVTVSPSAQGFHPSHSSAMRVYERCAELSLPVFITNATPIAPRSMLEFGRPSALDEIARSLPSLRLVVTELGYPWIDETLILLAKHPHVYADLSGIASRPWQLYNALLTASSLSVMDKLLFGSGFPFETPQKSIETLYSVNGFGHGTQLPSVQRAKLRTIVERDSLACLGIESELSVQARTNADEDEAYDGMAAVAQRETDENGDEEESN